MRSVTRATNQSVLVKDDRPQVEVYTRDLAVVEHEEKKKQHEKENDRRRKYQTFIFI